MNVAAPYMRHAIPSKSDVHREAHDFFSPWRRAWAGNTDSAPIRASPSTIAERLSTALGQMWSAALVNRARSSSLILMETDTLRLVVMKPWSDMNSSPTRNTKHAINPKYSSRATMLPGELIGWKEQLTC